jgi:D-cysteine desulfhydrase family pyridoxal phosphate-dependent enzyme
MRFFEVILCIGRTDNAEWRCYPQPVQPPRVSLIQLPTPIHRLDRVSEDLGIDLWIKRDDLTGLAMGGNKGRKLEYLMAEVLAQKAQVVVTCGSVQSNFVRQLGAACSMLGVQCVAVVMKLPYDVSVGKPTEPGLAGQGGNALLDDILGVEMQLHPDGDWDTLYASAEGAAQRLEAEGLSVYRIPVGGSSALGGYAFFQAGKEIQGQTSPFDFILTSTSSGSTQAGLGHAFHGTGTRIIGIAADPEPEFIEDVLRVSQGLEEYTGQKLAASDFEVRIEWADPAYGVPSATGNEAIQYLARREGIFLDPIYSGKAFAGLLELAKKGEISGRVLFWHTGGVPALFAT